MYRWAFSSSSRRPRIGEPYSTMSLPLSSFWPLGTPQCVECIPPACQLLTPCNQGPEVRAGVRRLMGHELRGDLFTGRRYTSWIVARMMPARQDGTADRKAWKAPERHTNPVPGKGAQLYAAKACQPLGKVPIICIFSGFTKCSALNTGGAIDSERASARISRALNSGGRACLRV
jgi:hypothetical protein